MTWIPVSQRLPDPLEDVLVAQLISSIPGDPDPYLISIGYLNKQGQWMDYCHVDEALLGITHWQPLPDMPELPEEARDD